MASTKREPLPGVWGRRGPGAEPLVRGSGDEKLKVLAAGTPL